ncbi:uncharacterized protein BJ171DRAFT_16167 [Polychytrium aggregatum]|uniref:uncharacterized protein n=1 Tax=Polychytrium aggregatum TaxID=110093 RepID=UPI0022FE81C8|nr:uncharacterized protein BJ171DRAFT_16167 [Polychytrium aggregatum]KAI9206657.1 hypothetical protein BJ171DRAFT_16167 [Polychytrium aggregatum]
MTTACPPLASLSSQLLSAAALPSPSLPSLDRAAITMTTDVVAANDSLAPTSLPLAAQERPALPDHSDESSSPKSQAALTLPVIKPDVHAAAAAVESPEFRPALPSWTSPESLKDRYLYVLEENRDLLLRLNNLQSENKSLADTLSCVQHEYFLCKQDRDHLQISYEALLAAHDKRLGATKRTDRPLVHHHDGTQSDGDSTDSDTPMHNIAATPSFIKLFEEAYSTRFLELSELDRARIEEDAASFLISKHGSSAATFDLTVYDRQVQRRVSAIPIKYKQEYLAQLARLMATIRHVPASVKSDSLRLAYPVEPDQQGFSGLLKRHDDEPRKRHAETLHDGPASDVANVPARHEEVDSANGALLGGPDKAFARPIVKKEPPKPHHHATKAGAKDEYMAWTDVVRTRFPYFMGSTPAMSNLVKSFLKERKVPEVRVTPSNFNSTARPTLGIPGRFHQEFLDLFEHRFVGPDGEIERRKGSSATSNMPWRDPSSPSKGSHKRSYESGDESSHTSGSSSPISTASQPALPVAAHAAHAHTAHAHTAHAHAHAHAAHAHAHAAHASSAAKPKGATHYTDPFKPIIWSEIVRPKFTSYLSDNTRNTLLLSRIRNGIRAYLHDRVGPLHLTVEGCLVPSTHGRGRKTYGVPPVLHEEFLEWFGHHVLTHFKSFPEGANPPIYSSSRYYSDLERDKILASHPIPIINQTGNLGSSIDPARHPTSRSMSAVSPDYGHGFSDHDDASLDPNAAKRRKLKEEAGERLVGNLHGRDGVMMAVPLPAIQLRQSSESLPSVPAAADVEDRPAAISPEKGSNLVRYNIILKQVMPNYTSITTNEDKIEMKRAVKNFLLSKMSRDRISECILWSSTGSMQYNTYGIPHDLEPEFRAWAKKELEQRFGQHVQHA